MSETAVIVIVIVVVVAGVAAFFILKGGSGSPPPGGGGGSSGGGTSGGGTSGGGTSGGGTSGGSGDKVDCVMNDWGDWSACNYPCRPGGKQTRKRTIKTVPKNGGTKCGSLTQEQDCNTTKACTASDTCNAKNISSVPSCDSSDLGAQCCVTSLDYGACPSNYDSLGTFPGSKKMYCKPTSKACTKKLPTPGCPDGQTRGSVFSDKNAPYWDLNRHLKWDGGLDQYCKAAFGDGSYAASGSGWHDCGKHGGQWYTAQVDECCTEFTDAEATARVDFLKGLSSSAKVSNGVIIA